MAVRSTARRATIGGRRRSTTACQSGGGLKRGGYGITAVIRIITGPWVSSAASRQIIVIKRQAGRPSSCRGHRSAVEMGRSNAASGSCPRSTLCRGRTEEILPITIVGSSGVSMAPTGVAKKRLVCEIRPLTNAEASGSGRSSGSTGEKAAVTIASKTAKSLENQLAIITTT